MGLEFSVPFPLFVDIPNAVAGARETETADIHIEVCAGEHLAELRNVLTRDAYGRILKEVVLAGCSPRLADQTACAQGCPVVVKKINGVVVQFRWKGGGGILRKRRCEPIFGSCFILFVVHSEVLDEALTIRRP